MVKFTVPVKTVRGTCTFTYFSKSAQQAHRNKILLIIPSLKDIIGKLNWYKQVNGLSLERLDAEMGRDPEQLADWLSGRHYPCRRNREEIEGFLEKGLKTLLEMCPAL